MEGLGVGAEPLFEELVITPSEDPTDPKSHAHKPAERQSSWIAKPVAGGQSALGIISRTGSMAAQNIPMVDPLVTLFGSVHEKLPDGGGSALFPNMGSMFGIADNTYRNDTSDGEKDADIASDTEVADSDDNIRSPLLSNQNNASTMRCSSFAIAGEQVNGTNIGGGWQLAYKRNESGNEGGYQKIYFHPESGVSAASRRGSMLSVAGGNLEEGEPLHAAAVVSRSIICPKDISSGVSPIGAAMSHHPKDGSTESSWKDLFEPGVKRALFVGVGLQLLQQVRPTLHTQLH